MEGFATDPIAPGHFNMLENSQVITRIDHPSPRIWVAFTETEAVGFLVGTESTNGEVQIESLSWCLP